ncbi:aminopeptidase P family protein [Sandaracinobacter neustonicus]|uniref:Aminopeptidase P family protein n=1 Tax=Sandaracinobacter neustonicus TaxID=1715348 RepID=A0A501XMS7_9SPHN|nr:M24 family metallopeptidase [Sandaracinobacter neustonicus]TPE61584.1 aminopeptidase P family protein [Sandaracinobacter neustonicus]
MRKTLLLTALLSTPLAAQPAAWPLSQTEQASPAVPSVLRLRERATIEDKWLAERLDTLALPLMREAGVDMWVLVAREYVDDPVLKTMLDGENFTARRRTILVLTDRGEGQPLERLTVSRYGLGGLFDPSWKPEEQPDQWARLAEIIAERNPKRIAINISPETAFADGLTAGQFQELRAALPPAQAAKLTQAGDLAVNWLATRTPSEMALYPMIVRTAHAIMAEGLSNKAITPGKTSVADLEWWLRERIAELKLETWFHPGVAIFRQGEAKELTGDSIFQPGDLVWLDFGISYLGLNTDTQHLAYILKPGETDAPAGLKAGLAAANKVQDAVTSSFRTGLSGNEILLQARRKALAQGLEPTIYSHPIGTHGHGAGAAIGFWDDQAPSPRGNHKLRPNTAWSIELSNLHAVPEWNGQKVRFQTEEDAFFDGQTVRYMDGRQTELKLIRPK